MRIILTGITGCLGQTVGEALSRDGHEVLALVQPANETKKTVPGVEHVPMDLRLDLVQQHLPQSCDIVIHLAQSRNYRDFPGSAHDVFKINTQATFQLADYARKAGAENFIFASTGSVYQPSQKPIDETGLTEPATFYCASKLAAENLLAPYNDIMPVMIARLFYLYGAGQRGMLIDGLAKRIRKGSAVTLQGEEGIQLTPTYTGDVAQILLKAISQKWSGTYNISSPKIITLKNLAQHIGNEIGFTPIFEKVADQAPTPILPETDKLAKKLGRDIFSKSFSTLAHGLQKTLSEARQPVAKI